MAGSAGRSAQHPFSPWPPLPCHPYVGGGGSYWGGWDNAGFGGAECWGSRQAGSAGEMWPQ